MAEDFRDSSGKETLIFVDNVFRFTQAGSEVSALLGRMPSAVGYQPTLAAEMGIDRNRALIVAGSTAPGEDKLLIDTCPSQAQLLIAPRKPEWFDQVIRSGKLLLRLRRSRRPFKVAGLVGVEKRLLRGFGHVYGGLSTPTP